MNKDENPPELSDPPKDISVPAVNPEWECERQEHERRMLRMSAIDWAIRTEDIASKGATDNPESIRERIIEHAKAYVEYINS